MEGIDASEVFGFPGLSPDMLPSDLDDDSRIFLTVLFRKQAQRKVHPKSGGLAC